MTENNQRQEQLTKKIKDVFQSQLAASQLPKESIFRVEYNRRLATLKKIEKAIVQHEKNFQEAVYQDFKRPHDETDLVEIVPLIEELKHAKKHLKKWMKPKKVGTPLPLLGSTSKVIRQPKGVSLIISPWNYPIYLALSPLISAMCAGNHVIIKPSEHTPHVSAALGHFIEDIFEIDEVCLFQGDVEVSKTLLELPFHHIFVTGSPQLGKIVMAQAAKNLSSVTLELGGKSPTFIDKKANLKLAAQRVAWGKFLNNGQTCVAPDYCLVHQDVLDQFTELLKKEVVKLYGTEPLESSSYARIVNSQHFQRLKGLIEDATQKGAQALSETQYKEDENYISPTILKNVDLNSNIMSEEIFGPILPLITINNIDEGIKIVQSKERPLSLYVYSQDESVINKILHETVSGSFVVNHNVTHLANSNLPFGGVNNSGIGSSHGEYGFKEFTHEKAFFHQWFPISASDLLTAPYNDFKRKLIAFTKKYL